MSDVLPSETLVASPDELFIGLVRAIGTDLGPIESQVSILLTELCGYRVEIVKLSALLSKVPGAELASEAERGRYRYVVSRMNAGDAARKIAADYVALLAIENIAERREAATNAADNPRVAWILDSVMNPSEVATLRSVYGQHYLLIGVYEDPGARYRNLLADLAPSAQLERRDVADLADELIRRDRGTPLDKTAVAIEDTFHLADVFVDVADPLSTRKIATHVSRPREGVYTIDDNIAPVGLTNWTIRTTFEQLFGARNFTPTRHEQAMAHAFVAAIASGSLSRRVGAVLTTSDGEVVAIGLNDVPAKGGGHYPAFDSGTRERIDARDHRFLPNIDLSGEPVTGYGYDANDLVKFDLFRELLDRLKEAGAVGDAVDAWSLLTSAPALAKAKLFDVIEYGRAVHAEMSALMSAARRGVSVTGLELYCTTFPCHECARHLIAAGIRKVIYLEPYPKSRVQELHHDAVVVGRGEVESPDARRPTEFLPFIGISPSRHADLYSWLPRKPSFGTGDFPPGQAIESTTASALAPEARLRWALVDDYHDALAPLRWLFGESTARVTLEALRQVEVEEPSPPSGAT